MHRAIIAGMALATLSGPVAAQTAKIRQAIEGRFRIFDSRDPVDDKRTLHAIIGTQGKHVAVGCSDHEGGGLQVVAKFDQYVGDAKPGLLAGGRLIYYRFDDQPALSGHWHSWDSTVATGENASPAAFVEGLAGSTRLFLRTEDYDGRQVEMAYTYPDPSEELKTVLAYCRAK